MAFIKEILIEEIKELLPHEYPMLLIDRVIDLETDKCATGIKNVTFNEPFFTGHFREKSLMPGVLIAEAMAQTAGVLIKSTIVDPNKCKLVFFLTIDKAKFRKQVIPGDRLVIKVEKARAMQGVWRFTGKAYVDDKLVAESDFSLAILD